LLVVVAVVVDASSVVVYDGEEVADDSGNVVETVALGAMDDDDGVAVGVTLFGCWVCLPFCNREVLTEVPFSANT